MISSQLGTDARLFFFAVRRGAGSSPDSSVSSASLPSSTGSGSAARAARR
jgi:hypothetical protein